MMVEFETTYSSHRGLEEKKNRWHYDNLWDSKKISRSIFYYDESLFYVSYTKKDCIVFCYDLYVIGMKNGTKEYYIDEISY